MALTPIGNLAKLHSCGSSSLIKPYTRRNSAVKAGWSTGKKKCSCRRLVGTPAVNMPSPDGKQLKQKRSDLNAMPSSFLLSATGKPI